MCQFLSDEKFELVTRVNDPAMSGIGRIQLGDEHECHLGDNCHIFYVLRYTAASRIPPRRTVGYSTLKYAHLRLAVVLITAGPSE